MGIQRLIHVTICNEVILFQLCCSGLTHWDRVTRICVSDLTISGSDNGLSPGRRQAIIWTNEEILLIGYLGTNFSEILFGIQAFSFNKMHLKMSSAKWRPFCLGLNVLILAISYFIQLSNSMWQNLTERGPCFVLNQHTWPDRTDWVIQCCVFSSVLVRCWSSFAITAQNWWSANIKCWHYTAKA